MGVESDEFLVTYVASVQRKAVSEGRHERFLLTNDASGRVFEQSESPHGRHAGGATLERIQQD